MLKIGSVRPVDQRIKFVSPYVFDIYFHKGISYCFWYISWFKKHFVPIYLSIYLIYIYKSIYLSIYILYIHIQTFKWKNIEIFHCIAFFSVQQMPNPTNKQDIIKDKNSCLLFQDTSFWFFHQCEWRETMLPHW